MTTTTDLSRRVAALAAGRSRAVTIIRISGGLADTPEETAILDTGRAFCRLADDLMVQAEGETEAAFAARITAAAAAAALPFAFITAP